MKIFFCKIGLVLSIKVILYSICVTSFYWWKSKNKVFRHENTSKSHKNIKMSSKKIPLWFRKKFIDPIRFMKLLWSISAHLCFLKKIWWTDTPWFKCPKMCTVQELSDVKTLSEQDYMIILMGEGCTWRKTLLDTCIISPTS